MCVSVFEMALLRVGFGAVDLAPKRRFMLKKGWCQLVVTGITGNALARIGMQLLLFFSFTCLMSWVVWMLASDDSSCQGRSA